MISSSEDGVAWIQEQDTDLQQGGIWSERRGLHILTTALVYLKSFPYYMSIFLLFRPSSSSCTGEIASPSQRVEIVLKPHRYSLHLAFCFHWVCSIPLREESKAMDLAIPHLTNREKIRRQNSNHFHRHKATATTVLHGRQRRIKNLPLSKYE